MKLFLSLVVYCVCVCAHGCVCVRGCVWSIYMLLSLYAHIVVMCIAPLSLQGGRSPGTEGRESVFDIHFFKKEEEHNGKIHPSNRKGLSWTLYWVVMATCPGPCGVITVLINCLSRPLYSWTCRPPPAPRRALVTGSGQ